MEIITSVYEELLRFRIALMRSHIRLFTLMGNEDPDETFHFDTDTDPTFHFDPDPAHQSDAILSLAYRN